MMTMFFWCGVSTFAWGVLFGGFFGDAIDVVAHTFFGVPKDVAVFKPLWFAPLEKPMKLLVYSFAFGIAHLFCGLLIIQHLHDLRSQVINFAGNLIDTLLHLALFVLMCLLKCKQFCDFIGQFDARFEIRIAFCRCLQFRVCQNLFVAVFGDTRRTFIIEKLCDESCLVRHHLIQITVERALGHIVENPHFGECVALPQNSSFAL